MKLQTSQARSHAVLRALVAVFASIWSGGAFAQPQEILPRQPRAVVKAVRAAPAPQLDFRQQANANSVSIITGSPSGTYILFAHDMSSVLDKPSPGLRVIPMLGKGSVQNVKDILYLRGVDMGIVQSDVMRYFKDTGELGRDIQRRLVYITKLYNEEFHIVAGKDVRDLKDLAGKKVNFDTAGSGTQFSARIIFGLLNLKVEEVNVPQNDGLEMVKSGQIAATLFVAGRPATAVSRLTKEGGYKLLPVPYTRELENDYLPAQFSNADYPNLVGANEKIETIAVGAVLASFNWERGNERYRKTASFIDALFQNSAGFQKAPRHPKWKEVNFAAPLPGWTRFPAAEEWLAGARRGGE